MEFSGSSSCHRIRPVLASNAMKFPEISPVNKSPPAVVRTLAYRALMPFGSRVLMLPHHLAGGWIGRAEGIPERAQKGLTAPVERTVVVDHVRVVPARLGTEALRRIIHGTLRTGRHERPAPAPRFVLVPLGGPARADPILCPVHIGNNFDVTMFSPVVRSRVKKYPLRDVHVTTLRSTPFTRMVASDIDWLLS